MYGGALVDFAYLSSTSSWYRFYRKLTFFVENRLEISLCGCYFHSLIHENTDELFRSFLTKVNFVVVTNS